MHINILSEKQKSLLPFISEFKKEYFLVGGTALALYLGHRESVDFDLFNTNPIKRKQIKNTILKMGLSVDTVIYEAFDQMHLIIDSVKVTFFQFPHTINPSSDFNKIINLPSLLDLASMKAYALGGRAKWKDYVDLYFIIKYNFSVQDIIQNTQRIFGTFFNPKLFKEQLSWFEDIDYSEPIIYFGEIRPSETEIKAFLTQVSLDPF